MSIGQTEMSIRPLDIGQTEMSIRPLDEQKCPLDKQKCPLHIHMSVRP